MKKIVYGSAIIIFIILINGCNGCSKKNEAINSFIEKEDDNNNNNENKKISLNENVEKMIFKETDDSSFLSNKPPKNESDLNQSSRNQINPEENTKQNSQHDNQTKTSNSNTTPYSNDSNHNESNSNNNSSTETSSNENNQNETESSYQNTDNNNINNSTQDTNQNSSPINDNNNQPESTDQNQTGANTTNTNTNHTSPNENSNNNIDQNQSQTEGEKWNTYNNSKITFQYPDYGKIKIISQDEREIAIDFGFGYLIIDDPSKGFGTILDHYFFKEASSSDSVDNINFNNSSTEINGKIFDTDNNGINDYEIMEKTIDDKTRIQYGSTNLKKIKMSFTDYKNKKMDIIKTLESFQYK